MLINNAKVKGRSERNIVDPYYFFVSILCLPHNLSLFYILLILSFRLLSDKALRCKGYWAVQWTYPISGFGTGQKHRLGISVARHVPSRPGPIPVMGWDGTGKPKVGMGWARVMLWMIWDGPGILNRPVGRARVIEKCLVPSHAQDRDVPSRARGQPRYEWVATSKWQKTPSKQLA